ncbi:hypothetical protein [Luteitalea sp.]|uniref:hypothetical protein n=1 Tax=Luteitalea sp. TaxID=2004800 RepID=UPI0025BDB8C2|nr:hypothetical protein [Luteitalea sp.]
MPSAEKARLGQYITADPAAHPDLTDARLQIVEVLGDGDDTMYAVRGDAGLVTGLGGRLVRYVRADEALPAPAVPGERPRVIDVKKETVDMSATQNIINLANQLGGRREDYIEAGWRLQADVTAYQEQFRSPSSEPAALSSRSSEHEVRAELERVKRERGCTYTEAGEVILANAGAARFTERVVQLRRGGLDDLSALRRASQEDPAGAEHYRVAGLL